MVPSHETINEKKNIIFSFRSFFLPLYLNQLSPLYNFSSSNEDDTPFNTISKYINYVAQLTFCFSLRLHSSHYRKTLINVIRESSLISERSQVISNC